MGWKLLSRKIDIDDAFRVFSIPMFFDSYDELYYVMERMTPELSQRLDAKGYVLLNWAHAGSVLSARSLSSWASCSCCRRYSSGSSPKTFLTSSLHR